MPVDECKTATSNHKYRAYTKEWCGIKSEYLLKPHHSFVYALYMKMKEDWSNCQWKQLSVLLK
jgi:hypothetical protein